MNTVELGALGRRRKGDRLPRQANMTLRRLQGAQQVTMFSQPDPPPFDRGTTWSTVRLLRSCPQYWQVQRSRAKTARRVILRR